MVKASDLPIEDVLPEIAAVLVAGTSAVLVAPPGAGKTTRVPLALLDAPWLAGRKIIVLEPRRLAARAAAARMAALLGEGVGERSACARGSTRKVSARTRIEVVTEGVFTRMILDDPELRGVGAVLFDEFHERSLDADLGLALALDARAGLREDLRILVDVGNARWRAGCARSLATRRSSRARAAPFPSRRAISAKIAQRPHRGSRD